MQAVIAGPGLAAGDAAYLTYLKSQGISLAQLPAGSGKNGFVERFEVCVRKDFLVEALQDQAVGGLEGLQAGFDDWLERYNHATPLAGYPTMGRTAMEVFRTAVRPAAETEPEPRPPLRQQPRPRLWRLRASRPRRSAKDPIGGPGGKCGFFGR